VLKNSPTYHEVIPSEKVGAIKLIRLRVNLPTLPTGRQAAGSGHDKQVKINSRNKHKVTKQIVN
jgi:hypothetical protein